MDAKPGHGRGGLIVFEGADESGKTTISKLLAEEIFKQGEDCIWLAFPGQTPGTLGAEVYSIHHDARFAGVPALSMQLIHIAAHVEAIERNILPALARGAWIVLDRYWWSTWVYGVLAGANQKTLQHALEIEFLDWGTVLPTIAFLFLRNVPGTAKPVTERVNLQTEYKKLARRESRRYPVEIVDNSSTIEDAFHYVLSSTLRHLANPQ